MSLKKSIQDRDKAYLKVTNIILKPLRTKLDKVAVQLLNNNSKIDWTYINIDTAGTVAIHGLINFKLGDTFYDINTNETVTITKENMEEHSHYVNLTIPVKNLEKSSVDEIVEIIKQTSKDDTMSIDDRTVFKFDAPTTRQ